MDGVARLDSPEPPFLSVGEYAQTVLSEKYTRLFRSYERVAKEGTPESLHQMRVTLRRLGATLLLFDQFVILPKPLNRKSLRVLTTALGSVRDRDIEIEILQTQYYPLLKSQEQEALHKLLSNLQKLRRKGFSRLQEDLENAPLKKLHSAWQEWLSDPYHTPLSQLPLTAVLPDLLLPLVSRFLLHPGWFTRSSDPTVKLSETEYGILHDLRKLGKRVRYQSECFIPFYGEDFQSWLSGLENLQTTLGRIHDVQVIQRRLADLALPGLHQVLTQQQADAMLVWQTLRQQYLDLNWRGSVHQLLLSYQLPAQGS